MTTKENSGQAFPKRIKSTFFKNGEASSSIIEEYEDGLSARAYAAIKLRVPDSGIDWLDAMIMAAKRDEMAKAAMQTLVGQSEWHEELKQDYKRSMNEMTYGAYVIADAMLA